MCKYIIYNIIIELNGHKWNIKYVCRSEKTKTRVELGFFKNILLLLTAPAFVTVSLTLVQCLKHNNNNNKV